jgi:ankyrin repeat protein
MKKVLLLLFISFILLFSGCSFNNSCDLYHASGNGDTKQMEYLIKKGVEINKKDISGNASIHYAVNSGNFEAISLLIKNKADINMPDQNGHSPLKIAARKGNKKIVELLLKNNAIIDSRVYSCYNNKLSQLSSLADTIIFFYSNDFFINFSDQQKKFLEVNKKRKEYFEAIAAGDIPQVDLMIKSGIPVNLLSENCDLPVWAAARNSKNQMVNFFIDKGADINSHNLKKFENIEINDSLLDYSIKTSNKELLQILISHGIELNIPGSLIKQSPLELAVKIGNKDILIELLNHYKEIDETNGIMSAAFAARSGEEKLAILELLIKKTDIKKFGCFIMAYAASSGSIPVIKFLEKNYNIPLNCIETREYSITKEKPFTYITPVPDTPYLIFQNYDFSKTAFAKSKLKYSALGWAAYAGKIEAVKFLLNSGVVFNNEILSEALVKSLQGYPPHERIQKYTVKKNFHERPVYRDICKLLIEKGANLNYLSEKGETPLSIIINSLDLEFIEYLIKQGAPITKIDVLTAVSGCQKGVIDIFMNNGLDLNKMGINDLGFFMAVNHKCLPLAKYFSGNLKWYIKNKDKENNTALHFAVSYNSEELVNLVLQNNAAFVNSRNNKGESALHIAVNIGNIKIVEQLINAGAYVNLQDKEKKTALDHAKAFNQKKIYQLLLNADQHLGTGFQALQWCRNLTGL